MRTLILLAAVAGCVQVMAAQPPAAELLEEKLLAKIGEIDSRVDGVLGVAAVDLTTGRTVVYHGDTVFPTASSIKIPILIRMFRDARAGEFRWDDSITLTPEESVGGSGVLQTRLKNGPVTLTVRELATEMIRSSDNTATNRCIRLVKRERVNRLLDEMGFSSTRLRRVMMDTAAAGRGEENVSTPLDMARLVERIYRNEATAPEDCGAMLSMMKQVKADMRAAVPAGVEIASKPGDLTGVHTETGVVFLANRPFVLSVMSTFLGEKEKPILEVTRLVYAHFEKLARANQFGNFFR